MPDRITVAGAGEGALGDVVDRTTVGFGEVRRELLDECRENDADDDRSQDVPARVDGRALGQRLGRDAADGTDVGPRTRHEEEDRGQHQQGRNHRGNEEATIDRTHAGAIRGAGGHGEDADDGGDDADRGDHQREYQAELAESRLAEDQGRDEGHGVGLEEVRSHAGAVADVVAHVVGDGGGVAGVVFGDALLDLAHEVGADVGCLGEDAAADTHEHGEQRRAEAEALEHLGRLTLVDEDDDGCTEQAEADGEHAGHATGAEGDLHGLLLAGLVGGSRHAHIAAHGQPHAHVAGDSREDGTHEEEDAATDALAHRLCG